MTAAPRTAAPDLIGVDNILVGADDEGAPIAYGPFCEAFDALADDAARFGVRIGFENTPFSYRIRTTEEAIALVTQVANANAGVELDDSDAEPVGTLLEGHVRPPASLRRGRVRRRFAQADQRTGVSA